AQIAFLDDAIEHGATSRNSRLGSGNLGVGALDTGPGRNDGLADLVIGGHGFHFGLDLLDIGLADTGTDGAAGIDRNVDGKAEAAANALAAAAGGIVARLHAAGEAGIGTELGG